MLDESGVELVPAVEKPRVEAQKDRKLALEAEENLALKADKIL